MLLIFAAGLTGLFRFGLNRHNFATGHSPPAADGRGSATASKRQLSGKRPGIGIESSRISRNRGVPKSWASAGAFSLLTPRSNLAQY
jgi:hypothetical protein